MRYSNIDSNTQNSTLIFYIARASNTFETNLTFIYNVISRVLTKPRTIHGL